MKIITADERLAEPRGVKALIVGPTGVDKTSLLRTLDSTRTRFADIEAGGRQARHRVLNALWATIKNPPA
jgi:predicted GTPase